MCVALVLAHRSQCLGAPGNAWKAICITDRIYAQELRQQQLYRNSGLGASRLQPVPEAHPIELKATLVVTKVTLLGQWQDEIRRFAPSLRVVVYHGTAPKDKASMFKGNSRILLEADIVLATHAVQFPTELLRFHRLVVDESHAATRAALKHQANFKWGVTGTPMSGDVQELSNWGQVLGHWGTGLQLSDHAKENESAKVRKKIERGHIDWARLYPGNRTVDVPGANYFPRVSSPEWLFYEEGLTDRQRDLAARGQKRLKLREYCHQNIGKQAWAGMTEQEKMPYVSKFCRLVDPSFNSTVPKSQEQPRSKMVPRLRKLMIRHTKAQVIGAGQALSLPTLASKTVMLSMDAATQETYTQAVRQFTCGGSSRYHSLCQKGSSVFGVNMALSPIMAICYTASAKIDALCNDLEELQHTERHPHAVVFTHSQNQHKNIV